MNDYIAIIDLGLSNLYNVKLACDKINLKSKFVSDKSGVDKSKALILPGVGSFKIAMQRIKKLNLEDSIKKSLANGKPFLGICLGMQLLFTTGEESGKTKGLNIFNGKVKKFNYENLNNTRYSVPHVGWNSIEFSKGKKNNILNGIKEKEFMYFVHSYYVETSDKKIISTKTKYGRKEFCSSVSHKNIFACQFHPERSGTTGIKIYKNFKKIL
tara:strand:- start:6 stop:644 length:639 start_codon:yes stop_codon:yes gene_type:complete